MQFGEGIEGAEETAFSGSDGAGDERKQAGFDAVVDSVGRPGECLHCAEAAKTPEVLGEFVDEDFFGGVGRLVLAAERCAEFIELGGIFTGLDDLLRVEAMLEGVLRGVRFAFGGARTGGVLGVAAVDFGAARFVSERLVVDGHESGSAGTVPRRRAISELRSGLFAGKRLRAKEEENFVRA